MQYDKIYLKFVSMNQDLYQYKLFISIAYSPFKCKQTIFDNIWEHGHSYFFPNCFLLFGGAVNQVFYGESCVLGSSQSAVG